MDSQVALATVKAVGSILISGGIFTLLYKWIATRNLASDRLTKTYLDRLINHVETCEEHVKECEADRDRINNRLDKLQDTVLRLESFNVGATVICDSTGKIVEWTPVATLLFHYPREEVIGQNIQILMPRKYRKLYAGTFDLAVKEDRGPRETGPRDTVAIDRDQEEFPITLTLSSYMAAGARYFVAYIRKRRITPHHSSEATLPVDITANPRHDLLDDAST